MDAMGCMIAASSLGPGPFVREGSSLVCVMLESAPNARPVWTRDRRPEMKRKRTQSEPKLDIKKTTIKAFRIRAGINAGRGTCPTSCADAPDQSCIGWSR
jgi:hypothetical protein